MPVVATTFFATILLWVGFCPTQLLFYTAQERITAKHPLEINGEIGKEKGAPESTRTMQDGSYLAEAMEAVEIKVTGYAANYSASH